MYHRHRYSHPFLSDSDMEILYSARLVGEQQHSHLSPVEKTVSISFQRISNLLKCMRHQQINGRPNGWSKLAVSAHHFKRPHLLQDIFPTNIPCWTVPPFSCHWPLLFGQEWSALRQGADRRGSGVLDNTLHHVGGILVKPPWWAAEYPKHKRQVESPLSFLCCFKGCDCMPRPRVPHT